MGALNWQTWLEHGDKYLKSGTPRESGKVKLQASIRYNLLSIALESYVMGMLDFHKTLPDNHTYTDLITGLERVIPLDQALKERILKYENIQSICALDKYHISEPTEEELADLQGAIVEMSSLAHGVCGTPEIVNAG